MDCLNQGLGFTNSFNHAFLITEKLKPNNFLHYIKNIDELSKQNILFEQDDLLEKVGADWIADEAVGVAFYCAMKSSSFSQCLELSTNHSGDSDSTASMAAQLYVAHYGLKQEEILFKTDLDSIIIQLSQS